MISLKTFRAPAGQFLGAMIAEHVGNTTRATNPLANRPLSGLNVALALTGAWIASSQSGIAKNVGQGVVLNAMVHAAASSTAFGGQDLTWSS